MSQTDQSQRRHHSGESRLERRVLLVCDAAGAFIEYWGFKSIHGRVWALLALRTQPMSQIDVGETLGVSRSLISAAMSDLVGYGLVRPISDHRNAPYEAVIDVWPTISDVLRNREWMLLEAARNALESALEEIELVESSGQPTGYNRERIRLLLTMTELAQTLLKILIALRVPKSLEGFGEWVSRARGLVQTFRDGR